MTNSNQFKIQQPLALGTSSPSSTTLLGINRDDRTHILCENASGADKFTVAIDSSGNATTTVADTFIASGIQLSGNLDVQSSSLFTSTTNGDVQLTPNGTGSVNLDGTVKFKQFATPPAAFEGGMYADNANNLYFGVSS